MNVFVPLFSAHGRVDLVIELGGVLRRVQCKSSTKHGDVLVFRTSSNTRNAPKAYTGEVDLFGIYSPELERVYLVPVDAMPPTRGCLRLEPARNNQQTGIHWASEYEVRPSIWP